MCCIPAEAFKAGKHGKRVWGGGKEGSPFPRSSKNSTGKAGLVGQEARLEVEVSAYVFTENGTKGEITMETVRYAAAGQHNVVAQLCEQEDGRSTMKDLKFDDDRGV
jgi:hypothetical protein